MSKKERKKCEFEMDFKKFCRCSYLSNDEIISQKRVLKISFPGVPPGG